MKFEDPTGKTIVYARNQRNEVWKSDSGEETRIVNLWEQHGDKYIDAALTLYPGGGLAGIGGKTSRKALTGVAKNRKVAAAAEDVRTAVTKYLDDLIQSVIKYAGQGSTVRNFTSHRALTRALGPAGPGRQYHHIIEQTPANVARFGPEAIHNTANVVKLDIATHRQIYGPLFVQVS